LLGISRQMTLDLARKLDIPAIEGDIDLFDAAKAEEMFLTSTSLCIAERAQLQRRQDRRRPRAGSDHEAPDGRLHRRGGLRFR
jgi:branched-chain amino acid aminotransferase